MEPAVALDPDGARYLMRRAVTLLAVGRPDEALADLTRYLGLGDDLVRAHQTLAQVHLPAASADRSAVRAV
ncbi:hypothetical protein AQJ43_05015 [Streptomyces avermitilis]|uniref:Uncharacterized protein n=1 Tax=Streptomyces avermitilis TaxID=33903 RepID=A0A4D4MV83_STRAX|nr:MULTISPECIES: hypothetical protein [Streptomyces]KUN56926.1 hypothetical protein AQJ43_05015 [Streptomyces avermitilis]MYS99389.1 hypothetical protein [Streptomyces sp. SID5469]BBJ51726.1 hypothetical protein SAVMC3_43550 [Streptomyces avermitilis]GDY63764.1 hypothetical protein SAV14893_031570 [Streptomyces avermitilis]GDY76091.1 hypothetical protein SAV31267_055760 [Streptomyces avermitilis]